MADDVAALVVALSAQIDKFERDMKGATDIAKRRVGEIEDRFDLMNTKIVSGFTRTATALIGLFSAVELARFAKEAIEAGDNIAKMAVSIGITTTSLQELQYAARLAGLETEQFDQAILALARRIGGAQDTVDAVSRALGQLGINIKDLKGLHADDAFKQIADRISQVSDPFKQASLAADLFGARVGQRLLPLLQGGSAEFRKLGAEAHSMGVILSADTLKKAEAANDEFDRMSAVLRAAGVNITVGLGRALEDLRKIISDQQFQDGVKNLAENFVKFIQFIAENKDTILTVLGALAGGFAGRVAGPIGVLTGAAAGAIAVMQALKSDLQKIQDQLDQLDRSDARIRATADAAAKSGADDTVFQMGKRLLENEAQRVALVKQQAALEQKINDTQEARLKITVNKPPPEGPKQEVIDPDLEKAIEDTTFKTRILRGEFAALAEGMPAMAHGFVASKDAIVAYKGSVEELPPRLQRLNDSMRALTQAQDLAKGAEDFGKAFGKAFEDAVVEGKNLHDVIISLGKDVERIILRLVFTNPLERFLKNAFLGVFPFAQGGIMGPAGPMPLRHYAGGGVANSPQFAMFGEGSTPEAYVPVPAGRIPVEIRMPSGRGMGGAVVNIAPVFNVDARGADAAAVARVQRGLHEVVRTLPKTVTSIMHVQQTRGIIP